MAKVFEERLVNWWVDPTVYSPQTLFTFFGVEYDLYDLNQHSSVVHIKKKLLSNFYVVRISCPTTGISARFKGRCTPLKYDNEQHTLCNIITTVCTKENFTGLYQMSPSEVLTSLPSDVLLNEVARRNTQLLADIRLPKIEPAKILQFKKMVA